MLLLVVKLINGIYFANANSECNYAMYYPTVYFHLEKLLEDHISITNNGNFLVHTSIEKNVTVSLQSYADTLIPFKIIYIF